jgi:hypothetical protein
MLIILSVPQYGSGSGGGGGGPLKGKKPPYNVCDDIRVANKDVTLYFPATYDGRTWSTIPEPLSNPSSVTGGTSLYTSKDTYYCVVTVVGAQCTNYSKSYTWNVKSSTMKIPIPENTDFVLSVEFYEKCGNWDSANSFGRPFYAYSKYYQVSQTIFEVKLVYTRTEAC